MKTISRFAVILFTTLFSNAIAAQALNDFEDRIVGEWALEQYEDGGHMLPPMKGHENDKMVFYRDHTVKSVFEGGISTGTWQYDAKNRILTVTDTVNKFEMTLFPISISEEQFVTIAELPNGAEVKMFMKRNKP